MGSLRSRWQVESQRVSDALRRRAHLDAGPFRPARGHTLDDAWIPNGLAPYGFERTQRVSTASVNDIPISCGCDSFRRVAQRHRMVIDDSTGGLSIEERARTLVRVAACGTPVVAGGDLSALVPPALMLGSAEEMSARVGDPEQMAAIAYQQWSAVFDHFSPAESAVSITIASHRPRFIDFWLPQITQQVHRPVQVVVALHDTGFTEAERDRIRGVLGESGIDVVIVDVPSSKSLGATLDLARRRADGNVILKWDDDDLYGSNHVVDLLRARRYSGAPLVGKACDFVYVGSRDVTVRRHQADRETFSPTLSGNTLMIDREALDAVGGWSDVSLGEDASLIARVRRAGGNTYRTAGFGMIAVRHADPSRHTWNLDIESLVDGAIRTWSGLAPHAALVDVPTNVSDAVRRSAVGES
ncbi:MAG: glycosyltransferase family 2 protein [Actinomycetota bacterium]|nr:glycosyltransferase family 2 protein [Actinomycetota bacterium]